MEGGGGGRAMIGDTCPLLILASAILVWMEALASLLTLVSGGGLEPRLARGGGACWGPPPCCMKGCGGLCVVESDSDVLLA